MALRQGDAVDSPSPAPLSSTWPLPPSPLYTLHVTPGVGRSVVACVPIPAGTLLLSTSEALSPIAHTIFRPYRREVCAWCFFYDRGRALSHRGHLSSAGVSFCSDACCSLWLVNIGEDGLTAYQELETRERKISRSRSSVLAAANATSDDAPAPIGPSRSEVKDLVETFETFGENAKRIRRGLTPVRDRKCTQRALSAHRPYLDVDSLRLLLSAVLHSRNASVEPPGLLSKDNYSQAHVPGLPLPPSLCALAEDEQVYKTRHALIENLESFVELIVRLPVNLLPSLSAVLCHEVVSRAAHNAFSLRPSGASDGEQSGEYFGWGIWPEASFFNHSCAPNIRKQRDGRVWVFRANRDILTGEELCITYLGGDENDLGVLERRTRLRDNWGFICRCNRCINDSDKEACNSPGGSS